MNFFTIYFMSSLFVFPHYVSYQMVVKQDQYKVNLNKTTKITQSQYTISQQTKRELKKEDALPKIIIKQKKARQN